MTLLDGIIKLTWVAGMSATGGSLVHHLTFGSLIWVSVCAGFGAIAGSGFNDWRKHRKHGTNKITA